MVVNQTKKLPPTNEPDLGVSDDNLSIDIKKYNVLLIEGTNTICGTVLSQGVTFCVKIKCKVKHRTKSKIKAIPDNLYILKNKEMAFLSPTVSSENIDNEVFERWFNSNQTLHAWQMIFGLAGKTLQTESIATQDNLMAEKEEMKVGREYKTPIVYRVW